MTFVDSFSSHTDGDENSALFKRPRSASSKRKPRIAAGQARSWWRGAANKTVEAGRTRRAWVNVAGELFGGANWDAYINALKPSSEMDGWEYLTFLPQPGLDTEFAIHLTPIHFPTMPLRGIYAIVVRLERLKDGWNGQGSLAPSKAVIRDIYSVLKASDSVRLDPEIEVDDDGSVVLEWQNNGRAFALTFYGNKQVIGTVSPSSSIYPAWRINVDDASSVGDKLSEQSLNGFVRG